MKKETEVYVEGMRDPGRALGVELSFGTVSVSEQVIAYQRKRLGDNKVIDIVSLDLPEQDFVTQGLWYVIGERMAAPCRARFCSAPCTPPSTGRSRCCR